MQYILNEKEYEEYTRLKEGWEKQAINKIEDEFNRLKKETGIKETNISSFEADFILKSPFFVSVEEYNKELKGQVQVGEIGIFYGIKLFLLEGPRGGI